MRSRCARPLPKPSPSRPFRRLTSRRLPGASRATLPWAATSATATMAAALRTRSCSTTRAPWCARDLVGEPFKGGREPQSVYLRIALGMPGTPHPAAANLTEDQLIELVHYVLSLARKPERVLTNFERADTLPRGGVPRRFSQYQALAVGGLPRTGAHSVSVACGAILAGAINSQTAYRRISPTRMQPPPATVHHAGVSPRIA